MNRRSRLLNCLGLFLLWNLKHMYEFRLNGWPVWPALRPGLVAVPALICGALFLAGEPRVLEWMRVTLKEADEGV